MTGTTFPADLRRFNADNKLDLRAELDRFAEAIQELKVNYEQYFSGIHPLAPDKLHQNIKRQIRALRKAPFKNSALSYKLRMLEQRYNTYNTYWQRVLREREDGTYFKDVFKANMREAAIAEEQRSGTRAGMAEKGVRSLFEAYKQALEKTGGKPQNLDFGSFKDNLLKRAKDFQNKNSGKSLSFKVVVKNGKVSLQAKLKNSAGEKGGR